MSKKLALHVTELHAEAAAAEHVLHTLLSAAPQGASLPSAASPMVSKKLYDVVTPVLYENVRLPVPLKLGMS